MLGRLQVCRCNRLRPTLTRSVDIHGWCGCGSLRPLGSSQRHYQGVSTPRSMQAPGTAPSAAPPPPPPAGPRRRRPLHHRVAAGPAYLSHTQATLGHPGFEASAGTGVLRHQKAPRRRRRRGREPLLRGEGGPLCSVGAGSGFRMLVCSCCPLCPNSPTVTASGSWGATRSYL